MNWKNVNLNSPYERDSSILDNYTFDTLLLEISCNLRDINKETIRKQFITELENKVNSAKEIFEYNLDNILKDALKYRNQK